METDDVKLLTKLMERKIVENNIEIVGFNCLYSGLLPPIIHLAGHVKKLNSKIRIAVGGIHPTLFPKEILHQYRDCIDYAFIGEGEASLVRLLDCISTEALGELSSIDGLAFYKDDEVVVNPQINYIEELDDLAFPAVDLLNISDYFIDTSDWHSPKGMDVKTPVPVLTSRSCPLKCNFCSMHFVHGGKIRYRSVENVVEEIKMYVENYGLTYFNLTDDNLTINRKRLIKLCDLIVRENLNIQFSTENGVFLNTLNEEVLDAMSSAGLARLHLAFETGSDYLRNEVIGKHLYNKKIDELCDVFKKDKYSHIFLYGYFIIGLPEETEETLVETFQLITSFPLDNYSLFYPIPFPGTKLFKQCLEDKLFVQDHFYDVNMLVSQTNVGQMVTGDPFVQPYNLSIEKLIAFKEKGLKYLKDIRSNSSVPMSSPLRYKIL